MKGLVPKLVHVTHLLFLGVSLELFPTIFSLDQLCENLFCYICFKMSFSPSLYACR